MYQVTFFTDVVENNSYHLLNINYVLGSSHILFLMLQKIYYLKKWVFIISILQIRDVRSWRVKWYTQSHTDSVTPSGSRVHSFSPLIVTEHWLTTWKFLLHKVSYCRLTAWWGMALDLCVSMSYKINCGWCYFGTGCPSCHMSINHNCHGK